MKGNLMTTDFDYMMKWEEMNAENRRKYDELLIETLGERAFPPRRHSESSGRSSG